VGARLWIARIMVSWGLISAGMMFVRTPVTFCVLRFLLGVAEAGFFPGVVYYLSLWYPVRQRARAIAGFMAAIPVTGLIGGPLSGALLDLDGYCRLKGWQWLFLVEGLPAIILGIVAAFYLTDRPELASWLKADEREWLISELTRERQAFPAQHLILEALTNGTVWLLGIIFLLVAAGFYGYSFWSPLIVQSLFRISNLGIGLILGGISAITVLCMLLNSAHSDRTNERRIHIAIPLSLMGVGFLASAILHQPILVIAGLALVPIGHCSSYGPFWSMPTHFLTGQAAASGVALVATIASIGGFLGPSLIGYLKNRTETHTTAFILLGVAALVAGLLSLSLRSSTVSRTQPVE
jgi:MFS transporter, ACS family, tartrate transporter